MLEAGYLHAGGERVLQDPWTRAGGSNVGDMLVNRRGANVLLSLLRVLSQSSRGGSLGRASTAWAYG